MISKYEQKSVLEESNQPATSSKMTLLSSGSNAQGQLGNGSLDDSHSFQACSFFGERPQCLPWGTVDILKVAAGSNHTLVLLEKEDKSRELWGCGDGRKGQLGCAYQQTILQGGDPGLFREIQLAFCDSGLDGYQCKLVAATWETSFVVLSREGSTDILLSLGSDDYGDLGIAGLKKGAPQKDFYIVDFSHLFPDQDILIDTISTGQRQVIAKVRTTSSSYLVGWGASRHGQLGEPANVPFLASPRIVLLPGAVSSCSLGIQHTIVLHESGQLSALGSDRKGQLQVARNWSSQIQGIPQGIGCTWNGSYILSEYERRWKIYSSGSDSHSQLGWKGSENAVQFPRPLYCLDTTIDLACGSEHVLVLLTTTRLHCPTTEVWGWGWNEHGNLGLGHTNDVPVPVKLWSSEGNPRAVRIWGGLGTSWIYLKD